MRDLLSQSQTSQHLPLVGERFFLLEPLEERRAPFMAFRLVADQAAPVAVLAIEASAIWPGCRVR